MVLEMRIKSGAYAPANRLPSARWTSDAALGQKQEAIVSSFDSSVPPADVPQPTVKDGASGELYPLRRQAAAAYVRERWGFPCSPAWLAKLAVVGGGPVFRKAGRFPIYVTGDLDRWAASRISGPVRSTSELGK